jgi:hypothetical protein
MAMLPMLSPGANPGGGPTVGMSVTSPFGMPSPSGVGHNSLGGVVGGSGATKGPMGGKNSHQQDLISPHAGNRSTLTAGAPLSRSMGQYGKGHDGTAALLGGSAGLPSSGSNTGLHQIRGGTGQMRRIRGGLGPGKTGQAGTSPKGGGYSMNNFDTE